VLERRNGPRRLRNHDDYLFEVAMSIVQHAAASHQCYAASLPVFWPPAIQHTQFLQAHCVAADPAGVGTTGAQSTACVYGYARSACRRGETDHRLLQNEHRL